MATTTTPTCTGCGVSMLEAHIAGCPVRLEAIRRDIDANLTRSTPVPTDTTDTTRRGDEIQWLGEGRMWEPGMDIAGYHTDLTTLAALLYDKLRHAYPINAVPGEILEEWNRLNVTLAGAETFIGLFVLAVTDDRATKEG